VNAALAPYGNISPSQLALGARSEQRLLQVPSPDEYPPRVLNDGMSTLTSRLPGVLFTEEVEVARLDDLCADSSPSLLKIDVEGWEGAVLEGARQLTARLADKRTLIVVEARLSERDEHSEHLLGELALLRERGMTAFSADEHSLSSGLALGRDANALLLSHAAVQDLRPWLPA
jgi:FkbM family methyltransferase